MRTRHRLQQHLCAFWRENLPACALFFAIYFFGGVCGYASFDEPYQARSLPQALVFLGADYAPELLLSLLIALVFELFYISGMLLTAFQYLTLPFWIVLILIKSFFAGLCLRFCGAAGSLPGAPVLWLCSCLPMLASLPLEGYLAVLPTCLLWRRRERRLRDMPTHEQFLLRGAAAGAGLLLVAMLKSLLFPQLYLVLALAG